MEAPTPSRRNLVYADYPGRQMLLDLYLPDTPPPHPLVLYLHGGGWKSGSKDLCRVRWLTDYGFAVASAGYRFLPRYCFPAQLHDAKAALRFLRGSATSLGLAPARIAVTGHSSGAYLANLLGVTAGHPELDAPPPGDPHRPEDHIAISTEVGAVVNYHGFSDFLAMQDEPSRRGRHRVERAPETRLLGHPVADDPARARLASPVAHLPPRVPPCYPAFLHLHGDRNEVVPADQSRRFHQALQQAGAVSRLLLIRGADHRPGRILEPPVLRDRVAEFLTQHLTAPNVNDESPTTASSPS